MKNKMFVVVAILLAAVGFAAVRYLNKPAQLPPPETAAGGAEFVRPHSPILGNTMARVTVVEWFDPECEGCRAVHPIFKQIKNEYGDRVRFVLRYMPYHQNSMYAASALEEAREQGKFEAALDALFERQPEWGDHHAPKPELIPEILAGVGVAKESLEHDALIKKHGDKIKQDEADGNALGVRGTPTFFVNGQMLQELGEQPLREMIEQAVRAQ
ncbi:MAG TPA: thioredoxin domain-containing protein [Bdellovibrionales bacterium]|nr:thioredoxin domain-containing protein [Bdellovibrionales bacterium]